MVTNIKEGGRRVVGKEAVVVVATVVVAMLVVVVVAVLVVVTLVLSGGGVCAGKARGPPIAQLCSNTGHNKSHMAYIDRLQIQLSAEMNMNPFNL